MHGLTFDQLSVAKVRRLREVAAGDMTNPLVSIFTSIFVRHAGFEPHPPFKSRVTDSPLSVVIWMVIERNRPSTGRTRGLFLYLEEFKSQSYISD